MAGRDDDGFLQDVLAFLDETPDTSDILATLDNSLEDVQSTVKSPASRPTRSTTSLKRNLEATRGEYESLKVQLIRLRAGRHPETMVAKEIALNERRKRQRAETECCALRAAVYAQRKFMTGLQSVFSAMPQFAWGVDLSRYLHRHTRLTRNRSVRWNAFDMEVHNTRMRAAMDVLCHETQGILLSSDNTREPLPLIHGESTDSSDCYTAHSMAVYAVNSTDLGAIVRATCVAIRGHATYCGSGHPLTVVRDLVDVDASPATNILYRVLTVRHACTSLNEEVSMETHGLTSYKISDEYAIVLWDFVDVDELHPPCDTTNIAREVTAACLIRREWCPDGVERTVFRSMATKKFRFLNQESARKLRRLSCFTHPTALVRGNEMLFRQILLDQLDTENAIYAQPQATTTRE